MVHPLNLHPTGYRRTRKRYMHWIDLNDHILHINLEMRLMLGARQITHTVSVPPADNTWFVC